MNSRHSEPESDKTLFSLLVVFLLVFIFNYFMMVPFVLFSSILFSYWSKIGARTHKGETGLTLSCL
ncbi:hypothetical protein LFML04_1690 [Leptospirillum ferriphilum ML-04]|uniref:Uncharacterized protein n=1 Tax=Leptospirillum ferriphilum (strain ML-04) TaxID=1048260 RepID=J9ZE22_LEPFM|nr:hypothetical protein LFML04_1690 [Leptospirillum ferriphilum ML-04]